MTLKFPDLKSARNTYIWVTSLLVIPFVVHSAIACEVGLDQYSKIKNGMTYVEVADIIGCKGGGAFEIRIFQYRDGISHVAW